MHTLYDAGYSQFNLEMMDGKELAEAMENAGVDTFFYDLDE